MNIELFLVLFAAAEIVTLCRAEWVYHKRHFVIEAYGYDEYYRLPSFLVMVVMFWIWDINTFLYRDDNQ